MNILQADFDPFQYSRVTCLAMKNIMLLGNSWELLTTSKLLLMTGIRAWNQPYEWRIPSRSRSSAHVDHIPALCTHHRPLLLLIEQSGEVLRSGWQVGLCMTEFHAIISDCLEKTIKLDRLEEVKIVTASSMAMMRVQKISCPVSIIYTI